jgi:hypothetical protein
LCPEDAQANEDAIAVEGDKAKQSRVLSSYKLQNDQKIWIITEWDRTVTTVLLPEEY